MTLHQLNTPIPEDRAHYAEISHPVHITTANDDNACDNVEAMKVFSTIATPDDKKVIKEYVSEHIILSDGWLIDEVLGNQIAFLDRVLH